MLFKNKNDFSLHPNVQSPAVPTQHPRKAGEQASTAPAKEGSTISTSTTIRVPRVLPAHMALVLHTSHGRCWLVTCSPPSGRAGWELYATRSLRNGPGADHQQMKEIDVTFSSQIGKSIYQNLH